MDRIIFRPIGFREIGNRHKSSFLMEMKNCNPLVQTSSVWLLRNGNLKISTRSSSQRSIEFHAWFQEKYWFHGSRLNELITSWKDFDWSKLKRYRATCFINLHFDRKFIKWNNFYEKTKNYQNNCCLIYSLYLSYFLYWL